MRIDKKSPVPVYYQLKNIILEKIKEGKYLNGDLIPSERELSESLSISRMTVRQALNQLVAEGVLFREKGKGTYVSRSKIIQRNIMSFTETVTSRGLVPSTAVLHFGKTGDRQDINVLLELKLGQSVYNIRRLRFADRIPIAIEEVFIPEQYCPNLENCNLESSLYRLLNEKYSLSVYFMDSTIQAAKAKKDEKKLLNLPDGIPVLRITSINYNETGKKLFYEKDFYRSDKYDYQARIFVNRDKG